ncbi:MAG: hypothetical protein ACJA2C_000685 [Marinoscillum sp.]|jgi:hypothetical protein
MKKLIFKAFILSLAILPMIGMSQSLTWTGATNTDFYDEQNWKITGTENAPADGSLVKNQAIAFELFMNDVNVDLGEDALVFSAASDGLHLSSSTVTLGSISTGKVTVSDTSTLIFKASVPLVSSAKIDLKDNHSWVKLLKVDPFVADTVYLQHISKGSDPLVHSTNALVNQYYFQGSLIRLFDANFQAVTIYDGAGQTGSSKGLIPITIHSRSGLGDFDNATSSFRLERGYQAVFSVFQNGKGLGQAFIASEEALEFDLPVALNNSISFIRVMPWNWVTKKGASNFDKNLNNTWVYNWGLGSESTLNKEYAPMSWGVATAATAANLVAKERVTHALGFNESDNCNDQSGQYGNLCQIDVAVPSFSFLQSSGLRLVSPSPRENGPFTWLKDFRDAADESNVRYDVLGVHWYDWGANPVNTPFEDPEKVFTRFKNYLDRVYAEHKLPIWITEFNANANRDSSVHIGFLKLALPYLETLDYVERYDFFSVNPSVAGNRDDIVFGELFNADGSLSLVGQVYKDHVSTPSIPEATWSEANFLDRLTKKVPLTITLSADTIAEGEVITITVNTDIAIGAPQSFKISIGNVENDQYTLRDIELSIPEGGTTKETILLAIDDDDVEDILNATVSLTDLSDGIEWTQQAVAFKITSEDVKIDPLKVLQQNAVLVYPNPSQGKFTISLTGVEIAKVAVYNMLGQVVHIGIMENDKYVVEDYNLKRGVYLVKVLGSNNEGYIRKVVIE